jgi:hypothetical protein
MELIQPMENRNIKIKYFESIPAVPKRDMILSRLGYRKGITLLDGNDLSLVEEAIQLGGSLCKSAVAYLFVPIASLSDCEIVLDNGICFQSQSLSKLLKDSSSVVLMASTVGKEVTQRIFHEVKNGDASKGLIIDSVASQTADAALDWMVEFLDKILAREGKRLTKHRYSPGFGDLPLLFQKDIFNALQLERLDMALTEKHMLVPEKSVLAIAGVEEKRS